MSGQDVSHDKVFKTVFRHFLKDLIELVHPELARMPRYSMHLALTSDKPVISVAVFLHGGQPGVKVRKVVQRVGPFEIWRFRYLAFGLSRALAEDYVGRPQPLAAALAALMRSEIWDRVEKKVRCLEAVNKAEGLDLARRYMLTTVIDTYVELNDEEERRYTAVMAEHKEVAEMILTWEEALADREAKGEARGEARGEAKGTREAIWLMMKRRFRLEASDLGQVREKLKAISDLDRLHEILERASEAERIEDVDLG